jgi:predicted Rossmann fold flavoprotein
LKPGLSLEELDERIQHDFIENINKDFANALDKLLPQSLIPVIVSLSGIEPGRKVNAVTKQERLYLAALIKGLRLTPIETAGYAEAVITMGGVAVKEINPSTMMSKKAEGLFFAGEVLDIDALTGGFNLQVAFSTGYLAGKSAAEFFKEIPLGSVK